jgi:murein DD-endopeptidase MepM/ murein hydrolase activator NlpD
MPGSPRAGFADHRTYDYQGQPIDKQVHLGVDIASTQRADVKAAEAGKVIFTGYNGIYGEMVVVDHGQGVFSLYSHLSQINVTVDNIVDQNTVLGLTGTTGMAGGDHLHFSMLINGIFVNPKEWWDPHWIAVTITEPLESSKTN